MNKTNSIGSTLLIFVLSCCVMGFAVAQEELQVQQQNDIAYVSGGISDQQQAAMKAMANDFNLHLTFAVEEGNYLADVQVRIQDQQGNTVLETASKGPLFYADLQPGTYTVQASGFGQSFQETVQVESGKPANVIFHWETRPEGRLDAVSPDRELEDK